MNCTCRFNFHYCFQDDKKLIRYRDGKIVSTKGERFTQVTKEESEEMKKSYVSWQPTQLRFRFKAPISELTHLRIQFNIFCSTLIQPLWLQIFSLFWFVLMTKLIFDSLCFVNIFLSRFYSVSNSTIKLFLIKKKPRWTEWRNLLINIKFSFWKDFS